ncbi:MAG: hydroxyacid dehydrogenase [Omnitrophica WOR_2 bacterium SM23_29]|nr:MAG: hydroxyacid dehydrogenase [Omnitrophica WOR_2 bacterium SM23_29]
MKKIAITTTTFGEYDNSPLALCKKNGFEVILNPYGRKIKPDEILELAKDAMGLIAGVEPMTREVLLRLPSLKVISRCGVGLDNVDLKATAELGIKVFNTPDAPTLAVAELTVGLLLNLIRKVSLMDKDLHNETWRKRMGDLLFEKKVGIIGFGRIGKKVAELLKSFNCEIAYADPFVEDGLLGLKCLSKEDLLQWADIITIHVSAKERILGESEFQVMKKGGWLINTSRGEALDENVLYNALKDRRLSGAALDVFEKEPYTGKLSELENVILTPHIGSYAKEARIRMELEAVQNLMKGLEEVK